MKKNTKIIPLKPSKEMKEFVKKMREFKNINQKLANKYNCSVSIGVQGNMVEIAKPSKNES